VQGARTENGRLPAATRGPTFLPPVPMRSRASFKGHPLHPALIPFPFAFLVGAFAFDLLGMLLAIEAFWITGYYLAPAGVLMALVAAIPGAVDYFGTVPPKSSGKRRATKHALANLGAVALFALAWFVRGHPQVPPELGTLVVQGAGAALLAVGGWMGGTLVFRNQIGVDHRYADAGKWNEGRAKGEKGTAVVVAQADELERDQLKLVHVDGRRIVLGRSADGWVAFDDRCSHRGASLADGVMICGTVQCPWHGSQFDCRTGEVRAGPAEEAIATYRVDEEGGEVRLHL
jgi:nitrite reductase/ring-hydroxylating ferredoxin subunit/uncharacterized membrane protein